MARHNSMAGGIFILLAIIVGLVAGFVAGQPTMGVIGGTAVGIVIAVTVWLIDRVRR